MAEPASPPVATTSGPDAQLDNLNWLLGEIRAEYRLMLSAFGALVEGIELASEQVQDKRLDLLETPPDVSLAAELVSVILVFGLHVGVTGKLVGSTVKASYTSIVDAPKTKVFEKVMTRLTGGFDWKEELSKGSPAFLHLKEVVKLGEAAAKDHKAITVTNQMLSYAVDRSGDWTTAGLKTAKDTLHPPQPPDSPSTFYWDPAQFGRVLPPQRKRLVQRRFDPAQGGDAPGVAFRREFRTTFLQMEYLITAMMDQAQQDLLSCMISKSQESIDLLTADFLSLHESAMTALAVSPEALRDEALVLFEKAIWMLMYGGRLRVNPGVVHDPVEDDRLILGAPQSLVKYWWGRFPDPKTGFPFANQPALLEHLRQDVVVRLDKFRKLGDFAATNMSPKG